MKLSAVGKSVGISLLSNIFVWHPSVAAFQLVIPKSPIKESKNSKIFAGPSYQSHGTRKSTLFLSSSSTAVLPSESSTIGTVGRGYIPVLLAKLAAFRSHGKSWIICPSSEIDTMRELSAMDGFGELLPNLELVPASDTDRIETLMRETQAMIIAVDDVDSVVDESVIDYLLDPKLAQNMKRVVAMSRNLNGSGMGMFATASKRAANAQVWDNSNADSYRQYESNIKKAAKSCGADWTVVRAGTLKGGASGENNVYPQYLAESYYALTKKDIVAWQLLFDCNMRGVKLAKGDVLPGPGIKAVFTATGTEEHDGDSGRSGVAEAMVRSLELDSAANVDFGVGTVASREPPSDLEWEELFKNCLE